MGQWPKSTTTGWIEVRDNEGRLLFLYSPDKQMIEVKRRHDAPVVVDLKRYQEIVQQHTDK
jgi:hypothetical protein